MSASSRASRDPRLASIPSILFILFILFILPSPGAAQSQPAVEAYLRDVSRLESWSFFKPFDRTREPDYIFLGNRATLGVRVSTRRFDLAGAFQYAQLIHLPERAIGPGALGSGGFYFFSAGATEAYQLYFKTMMFRVKEIVPGFSVSLGRMNYSSGEEAEVGDRDLDGLKHDRLGSRLVGEFDWSVFQRSFDGVRFDVMRPSWSATASVLFPTQGGYEESANPSMSSLKVLTAVFTATPPLGRSSQLQTFAYHYRDQRDVSARPDNSGRSAPFADVDIATIGASHVGRFEAATGAVDTVVWAAGQTGGWYGQRHAAFSLAVEGGYQWRSAWRPWVRAGYQHASGDSHPDDARHETFFAMLPSLNRYSQSATYAPMNLRDTFLQLTLEPHARIRTRLDLHHLRLADAADRWYHGSGATSRTGTFFGFSGRASGGDTELGMMTEGTVDLTFGKVWSARAYLGWMRGGRVVRNLFRGDRLLFVSFENVLAF